MVTGLCNPPARSSSSLFFLFFLFILATALFPSLSLPVPLNSCAPKVILLFFNRLPTARERVSPSLYRLIRAQGRLKFAFENYTRASPVRSKSNERRTEAVPE